MAYLRALIISTIFSLSTADVTVIPLTLNLPKQYESTVAPVTSDSDLLSKLHANTTLNSNNLFMSTYIIERINKTPLNGTYASQDSFFRGAIDAGAKRQHLIIHPQDVWITILKQLSFYMRKHKDDKEVAEVWDNLNGKWTPRFFSVIVAGTAHWVLDQFNLRSKADWMRDWVRPNFTTVFQQPRGIIANSSEEMLANALMMSLPSQSTEDLPAFPCKNGFPSITLAGTQDDWKIILTKVDVLEKFGKEPKAYGLVLKVVLSRFVQTFDTPNDATIRLFWNDMITITARQNLCITTDIITGWVNAFHMWDPAGNLAIAAPFTSAEEQLKLDDVTFPWRHCKDAPIANSHAPGCATADGPGVSGFSILVGMLAKSVKQGKPEGYEVALKKAGLTLPSSVKESDHSILQPLPIWISHADNSVSAFLVYLVSYCIRQRRD
jgi:hypothetical protein